MSARARARVLSVLASIVLVVSINPSAGSEVVNRDLLGGGSRWSFDRTEKCLMRKINNARQRNGRGGLGWDKQLGVVARRHSQSMASNSSLYHDSNMGSEITRWRRLGQNTGVGGGCRQIFRTFMHSSEHRYNILNSWRFIGVGTERRNGRLWAQVVFEYRSDPGNIYHYP